MLRVSRACNELDYRFYTNTVLLNQGLSYFGSQVKLLPYLKSFRVSVPELVKMPHSPVSFLNLDWK